MDIVANEKLKNILSKGPKYREPAEVNWTKAREEIKSALNEFLEIISNDKGLDKSHFSEWLSTILSQVDNKITTLNNKIKTKHIKSVFKDQGVKNQLILLKEKFVIVPIDKATNKKCYIRSDLDCNSKNVKYLISCANCNEQYVGSAIDFKKRFRIHKSDINTKKDRCGVARHFNSKCQHPQNPSAFLKIQPIEKICIEEESKLDDTL